MLINDINGQQTSGRKTFRRQILCLTELTPLTITLRILTVHTDTHTHPILRLPGLCPGLPGWVSTRSNLDFTEAWDSDWQWHKRAICKSAPQTDNHANIPPLSFHRLDAIPATQPTVSKHWRHIILTLSLQLAS